MEFQKILWKAADWLFPPSCAGCGEKGFLICPDCLEAVPRIEANYCSRCGKPLPPSGRCKLCEWTDVSFAHARAVFQYKGAVAEAIKRLKFRRDIEMAAFFADELAWLYEALEWRHDLVVPVPITAERRRERGFNQAELFGKKFADLAGLEFRPDALVKVRSSREQAQLSGRERRRNLIGAFQSEVTLVFGKRILLVDDVMTTGSTFISCTDALLDAGAAQVDCISVATTVANMAEMEGSLEP